jgi:hypothetical protein
MFETPNNFKKKLDNYLTQQMQEMNEAIEVRQRPSSANPQRIPSATTHTSNLIQILYLLNNFQNFRILQ